MILAEATFANTFERYIYSTTFHFAQIAHIAQSIVRTARNMTDNSPEPVVQCEPDDL
jgi:hypothetical protein